MAKKGHIEEQILRALRLTSPAFLVRRWGEEFGIIEPRRRGGRRCEEPIHRQQIAFALKQAETETAVLKVCRRMGVSEQTYYRWKKQYGRLGAPSSNLWLFL